MPTNDSLQLLESVCTIDSRTAAAPEGTVRVAELFGERLAAMGFDLEWIDPLPEEGPRGRHLKAVRHADAPRRLLLMGHTDTVLSPVDVPFRIDEGAGRVYGSGTCDMKGGCVVMLDAIEHALAESEAAREMGMVVLLNCTEEIAGPSFRQLARDWTDRAVACLSFEPARPGAAGRHQIVVARKGGVRFKLTCCGRAAHAGTDHDFGINAIREVARKVEQLEALTDYSRDLTVNVGMIDGGRAFNQVADEASIGFGVRAFDRATLDECWDKVRRICAEPTVTSPRDGATAQLELSGYEAYPPWPASPGGEALANRYIQLAARRGIQAETIASGGGADPSHVADLIPCVDGLGILGSEMHSVDEWADIASLEDRTRVAADLIGELCANPAPGESAVRSTVS